jgi:hypothetical protein
MLDVTLEDRSVGGPLDDHCRLFAHRSLERDRGYESMSGVAIKGL